MITQRFYLKEYFPELGENGCNSYMDAYIPSAFENAGETLATKKYPCMVVCPGGGLWEPLDLKLIESTLK